MARQTNEQLNAIQKKYGVTCLPSWSRFNSYRNSPYEHFLKYVKRAKETRSNIYGVQGNCCHQILEDLYEGKVKYEDMLDIYEENLLELNLAELKYDRSDEEKNKQIAYKYENSMRHFYENHQLINGKVASEKFILIKVHDWLMQGYIDAVHKENGKYYITDYKTSTKYVGKKILQERGQLMLYAMGINQMGIPMKDIVIQWAFLKYMDIEFIQKNGKVKRTTAERYDWVRKIKSRLKSNLRDLDWDELDIELALQDCIEQNSIDPLPQSVQDLYTFYDSYVEIDFTQDDINELADEINRTLLEIEAKTKEYHETKDDSIFFDTPEHVEKQSYYFSNLMGYSPYQHKPYKMYLDNKQMFKNDDERVDYSKQIDDGADDWLKLLDL